MKHKNLTPALSFREGVRSHIYQDVKIGGVNFAKVLRQRETTCEKIVRDSIRNRKLLGLKRRRQYPIGKYIADFYCHELQLIIEVDGGIHDNKEQIQKDLWREKEIQNLGIHIIRISNNEIRENNNIIKNLTDIITAFRNK